MSNVVSLFKNGIPSQKKVYTKIKENNPDLTDLSYKRFKRSNFDMSKIFEYFNQMDRYNFLSNSEINNIFRYLTLNLNCDKYSSLKNVVSLLNTKKEELVEKRKKLIDQLDRNFASSIEQIVSQIIILKNNIASRFNFSPIELENAIKFEMIAKKILEPDVMDEFCIIGNVLDNLEILSYHDIKGRNFGDLLTKYVNHARVTNNKEKLSYYKKLVTYIVNIKSLNIGNDSLEQLNIRQKPIVKTTSYLDEKINSLEYDARLKRYNVRDFAITIDNDDTIRMDDALSIERTPDGNYIVGIHITDVYSLGIFENELLDCKKVKEHVCKIKASLKEAQKKNCISLLLEISSNGIVLNHKLLSTRIEVDGNLKYDDVSRILHQNPNSEYTKSIINLTNLFSVLENDKFPLCPTKENLPHLIVNKLMLLYGCIISEEFASKKVPGLFLEGEEHNNIYTVQKAKYDTGFKGYESYSKATKPLYDKSSILNQFLVHRCLFNYISFREKEELKLKMQLVADNLNRKAK